MKLFNRIAKLFEKGPDGKMNPYLPMYFIGIGGFFVFMYYGIQMSLYAAENPRYTIINVVLFTLKNCTFSHLFPLFGRSMDARYIGIAIFGYAALVYFMYVDIERNKKRLPGREKGDAKWNDFKQYNVKFTYPPKSKEISEPKEGTSEIGNIILAKNVFLNGNERATGINTNILVVGTTGSGKTYSYVKPNILQFNTSYIITDPSGELVRDTGHALMEHGYTVKIFNLAEMQHSCMYNPFRYIRKDEDVLTLVRCLMKNTSDAKASKGDQFFEKAEECLFLSIFYYIFYEFKDEPEKQNFNTVMDMLLMAKVSERNEDAKSKLDLKFEVLEKKDPNSVAVKNYKIFKQGTGKTLKSILISAGVRMAPFNIEAVRNLVQDDNIHLEELGDRKQAIFIIIKAEDSTYNFLAAMMYTQMFETLYYRGGVENPNSWLLQNGSCCALRSKMFKNSVEKAEQKRWLENEREIYKNAYIDPENASDERFQHEDENGLIPWPKVFLRDNTTKEVIRTFDSLREAEIFMDCIHNGKIAVGSNKLASHVHCILDEFANIGEIPEFNNKLSTFRKYEISATIILQSLAQLKGMYDKEWSVITGNCGTQIFLGSEDKDDSEYFSEMLGETTISVLNTSISYKEGQSSSKSLNVDSARLMRPENVRNMDLHECLIIVRGQDPFRDMKYNVKEHKNYGELRDADPANELEYRRLYNIKPAPKKALPSRNTSAVNNTGVPIKFDFVPSEAEKAEVMRDAVRNGTAPRNDYRNEEDLYHDRLSRIKEKDAADQLQETGTFPVEAFKKLLPDPVSEKLDEKIQQKKVEIHDGNVVINDDDPMMQMYSGEPVGRK